MSETQPLLQMKDIKVITTSDPYEMKGKFTARQVNRTWTEDFQDEDTGEVISIERNEMILGKGVLLDGEALQTVMFHLQAGDIKSVECAENRVTFAERFIGNVDIPWEVSCRFDSDRYKFLVRCQSPEKAIAVIADYAPIYLGREGLYQVTKLEIRGAIVVDEDAMPEVGNKSMPDAEYFLVTVRESWWDSFENKEMKVDHDYIVNAQEIGEAKKAALDYIRARQDADAIDDRDYNAIKAKPYTISSIIPEKYCKLYFERQNH